MRKIIDWLALHRVYATNAILIIVGLGTVIYSLSALGRDALTPREANMFAVTLTIASLFLSWIMTTIYHNAGMTRTMRDKDVQRANQVQSIKRQLVQLRDWNVMKGHHALVEGSFDHHRDHLNQMLSAVDCQFDAMLKEIGGNIGDADRQAHELLNSVQELGSQIQNLETEKKRLEARSAEAASSEDYDRLQQVVASITQEQETLKNEMAKFATSDPTALDLAKAQAPTARAIECPYCQHPNAVPMVGFTGETRYPACASCREFFNAHCTAPNSFMSRPRAISMPVNALDFDISRVFMPNRDSISPPGFDYTADEFKLICDTLVASYAPGEFSIKSLTEYLGVELNPSGLTRSKISKFVQLLFWTRTFRFEDNDGTKPQSQLIITNDALTREELVKAFFRSLGYRMATVREVSRDEVGRDIDKFLKTSAPDMDPAQIVECYFEGRASAMDFQIAKTNA